MSGPIRIITGIAVVLLFLALQVGAPLHAMEHAAQHTHHEAASHSTTECSVMCAAGQVLNGSEEPVLEPLRAVTSADQVAQSVATRLLPSRLSSRGPPAMQFN
ncbi:MAG: hypothetical protein KF814_09520 [Nitrospiraceae bacterium]|nr:hypothetical protein [Nitrospiraceae bacterium]